jgi:hypothetical protein
MRQGEVGSVNQEYYDRFSPCLGDLDTPTPESTRGTTFFQESFTHKEALLRFSCSIATILYCGVPADLIIAWGNQALFIHCWSTQLTC